MDTKDGLVTFGLFVVLLVFTFVFSVDAIGGDNALYGVLALVGYVVCIAASIFNSILARHEGSALEAWFKIYAAVTAVVFIWFLTQVGGVLA